MKSLAAIVSLYAVMQVAPASTPAPTAAPTPAASSLSCERMEIFLKSGKVLSQRDIPVGVTGPSRATLDDGTLRHDASVQTVDIRNTTFQGSSGTELNFRDSWQFNVAGYELAKLLKLNMVPPYVERRVGGKDASVSWWLSDAMMERDRYKKKIEPPNSARWNDEMFAARVFHELIADTDFNMTNVLITKDWAIWMIDFSRAFRITKKLQNPKRLTRVDRTMLAGMRSLTPELLQQKLGRWLGKPELEGLLARRDLIVQFFDREIGTKGEAAVVYDLPRSSQVCGAGL